MPEPRGLLATKLLGAATQLRYLPRTLHLVWSAARRWSVVWAALLIVQGLLPVAVVLLTRELVDRLAGVVGSSAEWGTLSSVVLPAALMGGILLLGELLRGASDWVRTVQSNLVEDYISELVQKKSTTVDLAFYESPEYHDHLHRARSEAASRPVALLENGGGLIQNSITLVGMAAVLIPYGMWVPVALVASTIPALLVVLRFAVRQHRWHVRNTEDERRANYLDWVLTAGETAAELRLFGLGDYFRAAYRNLRARLRRERLQLHKAQGLADLTAGAIALMVAGGSLAWMVWEAIQGRAKLGDVALFYQVFSVAQRLVRSLLGNVGHIYYNLLFLGNLYEFLDLQSRVVDPSQPRTVPAQGPGSRGPGIHFRDVAFSYPGSERAALHDLHLEIPAGQVAAIVGTNGAGKSTLLKLLCRFYDPTAGRIELDGVDVRELSLSELRGAITVLFQVPVHYNATVAENISMGAPATGPARAEIEAAARAAGAELLIARLPHGYDTRLGTWFAGGVELSVGEWQCIALARAFLRRAPVIVLDEPTSAMDSWAEADWLRRFRSLADGRTAIIVTHRFTTAMQADVIHVMDDGRVTESGSHAELLAQEGAYARSWRMQMRAEQSVQGG